MDSMNGLTVFSSSFVTPTSCTPAFLYFSTYSLFRCLPTAAGTSQRTARAGAARVRAGTHGIATLHGGHHVAQNSTMETLPLPSVIGSPCT